jgi:hypothetical protein
MKYSTDSFRIISLLPLCLGTFVNSPVSSPVKSVGFVNSSIKSDKIHRVFKLLDEFYQFINWWHRCSPTLEVGEPFR